MASQLAHYAVSKGAIEGATSVYIDKSGNAYVGFSRNAGKVIDQYIPINDYIKLLNREAGERYWGTCAELQCYTTSINVNNGAVPNGGVMGAAQVGARDGRTTGTIIPACPSCSFINNKFGAGYRDKNGNAVPSTLKESN